MLPVAIAGCGGRMGRALVQAVAAAHDLELCGASEVTGSPLVGQDAGSVAGLPPLGVRVTADSEELLAGAGGVIDFTAPQASSALAAHCADRQLPLVIGTTGVGSEELASLKRAAQRIPLVFAPNMSVGVNLLFRLAAEAARALGPDYQLEIVEAHHQGKADAPSGTALRLAQVVAEATPDQGAFEERACYGRRGQTGARPPSQIGIHAVRCGDTIGEHTLLFAATGERVELTHRATSRQTFAAGALRALRWAARQSPGLYDMQDVLGLR